MVRADRWRVLVTGAIVAGLIALAMVAVSPATPAHAALDRSAFEQCLLDRVNDSRATVGSPSLRMAADLVAPVRDWSEWMRFNEFEHMPSTRRQDILPSSWTTLGENIAWHSSSSLSDCSAIHSMLMDSPGHRAN
ncbi:MAG: CAP domain-containing protein, partial [Acidimicrobiia bacterium]